MLELAVRVSVTVPVSEALRVEDVDCERDGVPVELVVRLSDELCVTLKEVDWLEDADMLGLCDLVRDTDWLGDRVVDTVVVALGDWLWDVVCDADSVDVRLGEGELVPVWLAVCEADGDDVKLLD